MAPKQVAEGLLTLVLITLLVVSSLSLPLNRRSLKFIKEINRKGPYIGLITVYPPEEAEFFHTGAFKPNPIHPFLDLSGWYSCFLPFFLSNLLNKNRLIVQLI